MPACQSLTLARYRATTQAVALLDLPYARSQEVEARLWSAHSRVNAAFRKQLSKVGEEPRFQRQHLPILY